MIAELIKRLFARCGLRVSRVSNYEFFRFESLLYWRLSQISSFEFIQIGGCDGVRNDPIHHFLKQNQNEVRGVVLEPLPDLFEQLEQTYRTFAHVVPLNLAIHNEQREMTIHRVDPSKLKDAPEYAVGISSFDPNHHRRTNIPDEMMTEVVVPCRTLTEIYLEHHFQKLDLLQIDAEGYDAEIVLGINFETVNPAVIRFEHGVKSGTMTWHQLEDVIAHLHIHGYECILQDSDAIAWKRTLTLPPENSRSE